MEDQEKTKEELLEEIKRLRLLLNEKDSKEAESRRKEQDKNRRYQKGLETIINSSGDIIFLKDTDFKYVIANKAHETLFHVNVDDIIGKTDFDFMPEDFSLHCRKSDEAALSSGEPVDIEEYAEGMWFSTVKQRVVDGEGNILGVVGIIRDITKVKKMEAELLKAQKLESLGILAGGIAHDFNNFLTGIMGNIYLAKLSISPHDKLYELLTESEKASLQAKSLAKQLLTFAKGGDPVKKTIYIGESIKDWCSFTLRGTKAGHECLIPDDLWPVEVEKGQIHQVINNLIINAVQSMPDGGQIKVQAENIIINAKEIPTLKKGRYVKITIEDHGAGIPEEIIPKIFDPFFTTKEKGSGLGLAIAYSIIKKHNGHISVESDIGNGTTFSVYLPASGKKIFNEKETGKVPLSGSGKVLVIDDEETIRDFVCNVLSHFRYEAESAANGTGGIELYKKAMESGNPFDVVIMDLTIPGGMGGKEAIRELLKIDSRAKVIVSSGYSKDPIMTNYEEYGFSDVLVKPYIHTKLCEVVHRVIGG
ncbi:MAG: response regulator [Nitrospirae bacterium]|nr:response regulator [Nitrospirota bacterium]